MKKNVLLLAALALTALGGAGCGLTAAAIDKLGEPAHIYHSGTDLLSGNYEILPKPDNTKDKPAPLALKKDGKGWLMSQPDVTSLHVYEMTPDEMKDIFPNFNPQTMQCAEVSTFRFCKAPKGTKFRYKAINVNMTTGYIAVLGEDWDHVRKK